MVLHDDIVAGVEQAALDEFDIIDNMGFSSNGTQELSSADTLTGEFLRKVLSVKSKDIVSLTYEFDAALGLTEENGQTLQKFGLFETLAGNDLKLSKVLPVAVSKTADKEINVGFQITVEVTDESG